MVVVLTLLFAAAEPGRAGQNPPTEVPGEQALTTSQPADHGPGGYVDVPHGRLYYETAGDGPALVLIHDGLLHSAVWDDQVPAFSTSYKVIRYDRRGFGRSPAPTVDFSNVDDLLALLQSLGVKHAALVGTSSGAELAIDFAVAHADMADALVLGGPVVNSLGYTSHFTRRNIDNYGPDMATVIEKWASDKYEVASGNTSARQRLRDLLTANPQNLAPEKDRYGQPSSQRGLERLADIRVPTLILVGEFDIPDVHAHAGAIESRVVGATRMVMRNSGHLVNLEQPEFFNQTVIEFLALVPLRRPHACSAASSSRPSENTITAAANFQSGFAPVSGTALYYEVTGAGPPLVLLHGGLVDHRMWDGQFDEFARHFRVVRYDQRGHGLSKSPPTSYDECEDLRQLMQHLGIPRAHIMGLSLGGRIAIDFALKYPDTVTSLVPVGPGLSGYEFTGAAVREQLAQTRVALVRGDVERVVALFQEAWVAGPQRSLEQVDPAVRQRVQQMGMQCLRRGNMGPAQPLTPPAVNRLPEIHVPTLTIGGELDQPEILRIMRRIANKVGGAEEVLIPGAAHMVNMEQPAQFNRIVLDFLSKH